MQREKNIANQSEDFGKVGEGLREKRSMPVILEIGARNSGIFSKKDLEKIDLNYIRLDSAYRTEMDDFEGRLKMPEQSSGKVGGEVEMLPFADKSVDTLVAANVFSGGLPESQGGLADDLKRRELDLRKLEVVAMKAVSEIGRVLKDNGRVFILETTTPTLNDILWLQRGGLKLEYFSSPNFIHEGERARMQVEFERFLQFAKNNIPSVFRQWDGVNVCHDLPWAHPEEYVQTLENLKPHLFRNFIEIPPASFPPTKGLIDVPSQSKEKIGFIYEEFIERELDVIDSPTLRSLARTGFERMKDEWNWTRDGFYPKGPKMVKDCHDLLVVDDENKMLGYEGSFLAIFGKSE